MPAYNRLMAYTSMFKDSALKEFESLAETSEKDDYMGAHMDTERRDAGDDHVDNEKKKLEIEGFESGEGSRNIGGSMV